MQAVPSWPRGLAVALAAGTLATALAAWPVLRQPTAVIFGQEIVGRHHDAYTYIFHLATGASVGPYAQPLTDVTAWLLGRLLHPVAAYNLLVLAAFPLTVLTTYALGRSLFDVHGGALVSGLAFAFAPLHLAHAAYHPHVAQTQWLPLYVLALCAFVSHPTLLRGVGLVASAAAVTLANYYGGFIAAVLTPVMLIAAWWADSRGRRSLRTLGVGAAVLGGLAIAAWAMVAALLPEVVRAPHRYAWPVLDLSSYSARWWAYVVPPVDHPHLGGVASDILARAGVTTGVLENQVSLSYALVSLAAVALVAAVRRRARFSSRNAIAIAIVGLIAAVISIGPGRAGCESASWAPACVLYGIAPMFRSYARFAFVTHLGVALLAGAGVSILMATSRRGRVAAVALLAVATYEYSPLPWRSHDVLPTSAHRWLVGQAGPLRILDCRRPSAANATVSWLMKHPLVFLDDTIDSCTDRDLAVRLRAIGITTVIVRRDGESSPLFARAVAGLAPVSAFRDADLYAVTAPLATVVTISRRGYSPPERDGAHYWRWMGASGSWHVRNTTDAATRVSLALRLYSEKQPRQLTVRLDGHPPQVVQVGVAPAWYELGPWVLPAGDHTLEFEPGGVPVRPSDDGVSADHRPLTIAFLDERWMEARDDDR